MLLLLFSSASKLHKEAETAMFNLLSNDVEQISQLKAFIDGCLDYHKQAVDILESLKQTLEEK